MSELFGGPGGRAPDQFWVLTFHSLLPSGPGNLHFYPSDLFHIPEYVDSVHAGVKRFVVAFRPLRRNNIHRQKY